MVEIVDIALTVVQIFLFPGFIFAIALAFVYEWIDRKFYARLQNRVGPLYTGPAGFLQPFADFVKLLAKEDIVPAAADRPMFSLTPIVTFATMLTGILLLPVIGAAGVVSFTGDLILAAALLTFFCILVFLSGTFSTNRFSTLGSERAVLQLLGYEIPLMLSIVGVALGAESLSLVDIVKSQSGFPSWSIFGPGAIGFAVFIIAAQAELERIPFDIPEAETEIVAGWQTELSGRKLAIFRLSTDLELVFAAGLAVTLFLGGPIGPSIPGFEPLFYLIYFVIKTVVVLLILSTLRALFARVRIDQMVNFCWKYLIPLSLLQLLLIRVVM